MSQPPYPYNRIFDFESFSIVNPNTQQPGVQIEGELDNIKRTLDGTLSRLSEIQRDDGFIRDSALDQSTVIPLFYSKLSLLFAPSFALKAPIASPTFTGVVTIPEGAVIVGFAKLDSPHLTGVPTAPTPTTLSASQQIANAAFVTAADAVIKQFVIDNYLKLDGDQMHDDSIIFWTKETPSQYAGFATNTEKDTICNSINKEGITLTKTVFNLSNDGDAYQGEYDEGESNYDKRETIITPGSIKLNEFIKNGILNDPNPEFVLKGSISIWSGEATNSVNGNYQYQIDSLPHIKIWDNSQNNGTEGLTLTANGIQFPDYSMQTTRGLNLSEVQYEAQSAAQVAVTNLVNGAPDILDTLGEIAAALANDANLAGTLTAAIALKADDNAVLKLTGGSMSDGAVIDIKDVPNNSDVEVAGWGFGVEQTNLSSNGATLENTGLHVYSAGSNMNVSATAITFPDGSIQSVAAFSTPGPQGDIGPQGPQGDVGPQGVVGDTGPQGDVGPQGPAGSDASMVGPQGPEGPQGPAGNDGSQGPQGDVGPQGPQGEAGYSLNINWRGEFSYYEYYPIGDGVSFEGSSYVAHQYINPYSWITPNYGFPYWQLIAAKGNNGNDGSNGGGIGEAPYNSTPYIRINNDWQPLSSYDQTGGGGGGIGEAPQNGQAYIRVNGTWSEMSNYDQTGGGGNGPQGDQGPQGPQGEQGPPGNDGVIGDSPSDSQPYIRVNNSWQLMQMYSAYTGCTPEAPNDNNPYVRRNNAWEQPFREFTPYNNSGDPFYPYEVKITVNGTDYWMPVRPA